MIFKSKYERLHNDLKTKGFGKMKCFGPSMMPILDTASTCYYVAYDDYNVGDIVFCKVNGRWIDSHLITQKAMDKKSGVKYMISNNHGYNNGWARKDKVFGKVVKAEFNSGKEKIFNEDYKRFDFI